MRPLDNPRQRFQPSWKHDYSLMIQALPYALFETDLVGPGHMRLQIIDLSCITQRHIIAIDMSLIFEMPNMLCRCVHLFGNTSMNMT